MTPELLKKTSYFKSIKVPSHSTCRREKLQVSAYLLSKVSTIKERWACIPDCSITIGERKLLCLLRVPFSRIFIAQKNRRGINFSDCECLCLSIKTSTTKEEISKEYEKIFNKVGKPSFMVSDRGEVAAGLREYLRVQKEKNESKGLEETEETLPWVPDLGHSVANIMKSYSEGIPALKKIDKIVSSGNARCRQTSLSKLLVRTPGSKMRYMNEEKKIHDAKLLLEASGGRGAVKKGSDEYWVREFYEGLGKHRRLIMSQHKIYLGLNCVMEYLKTNGLRDEDPKTWTELSNQLNCKVKYPEKIRPKLDSLLKEYSSAKKMINESCGLKTGEMNLFLSSDIIESVFSQTKRELCKSPKKEMGQSVLLTKLAVENPSLEELVLATDSSSSKDLEEWEFEQDLPKSFLKARKGFRKKIITRLREKNIPMTVDDICGREKDRNKKPQGKKTPWGEPIENTSTNDPTPIILGDNAA